MKKRTLRLNFMQGTVGFVVAASLLWLLIGFSTKSNGAIINSSQVTSGKSVSVPTDLPVPTVPGAIATIPWTPVPIGPTVVEPTLVLPTSLAYATPSLVVPDSTLAQEYGTWRFKAARHQDLGVAAVVTYDDKTLAGLYNYMQSNKQLAAKLATVQGEVPINITFYGFFEPDAFHAWAMERALHVAQVDTRVRDAKGMEGTLSSTPPDGTPPDRRSIQAALTPQDKIVGGSGTIVGIYYVRGKVDASQLTKIASDPHVFLADVTESIVRKELIAAGWKDAENAAIRVEPPHPFSKMEELGLVRSLP